MATERQKEYAKYLKSDDWKNRRNKLREEWGNKCCFCESTTGLALHHLNYDNLGKETADDVALLCKGCHLDAHKKRLKLWFFTPEEFEAYKKIKHVIVDGSFNARIFVIKGEAG